MTFDFPPADYANLNINIVHGGSLSGMDENEEYHYNYSVKFDDGTETEGYLWPGQDNIFQEVT